MRRMNICCGQDYFFKPNLYYDSDECYTIKFNADYFQYINK